jgi:site-specific DNA-methyltransferase (adenine-specific)
MRFNIIYADPAWQYSNTPPKRAAVYQYEVMPDHQIAALPVHKIAADDCALFLWATYPMLPEALRVVAAWGFTYRTVAFTWVKQRPSGLGFHFGLGYWTRGNPEICLLAIRGKPKRVSSRVPNLVITPIEQHSKKPAVIHDKIVELMGNLPRVELFARRPYSGWVALGNELDGQDISQAIMQLAQIEQREKPE